MLFFDGLPANSRVLLFGTAAVLETTTLEQLGALNLLVRQAVLPDEGIIYRRFLWRRSAYLLYQKASQQRRAYTSIWFDHCIIYGLVLLIAASVAYPYLVALDNRSEELFLFLKDRVQNLSDTPPDEITSHQWSFALRYIPAYIASQWIVAGQIMPSTSALLGVLLIAIPLNIRVLGASTLLSRKRALARLRQKLLVSELGLLLKTDVRTPDLGLPYGVLQRWTGWRNSVGGEGRVCAMSLTCRCIQFCLRAQNTDIEAMERLQNWVASRQSPDGGFIPIRKLQPTSWHTWHALISLSSQETGGGDGRHIEWAVRTMDRLVQSDAD